MSKKLTKILYNALIITGTLALIAFALLVTAVCGYFIVQIVTGNVV